MRLIIKLMKIKLMKIKLMKIKLMKIVIMKIILMKIKKLAENQEEILKNSNIEENIKITSNEDHAFPKLYMIIVNVMKIMLLLIEIMIIT